MSRRKKLYVAMDVLCVIIGELLPRAQSFQSPARVSCHGASCVAASDTAINFIATLSVGDCHVLNVAKNV